MARIKLQAPWIQFYEKTQILFREDPDIRILYDEDENHMKIYASDVEKANILSDILPTVKKFGNVEMKISVVCPNNTQTRVVGINAVQLARLFMKNPVVVDIETVSGIFPNDLTYVIFRKEVVQYYNDDLGDYHGNCSILFQEIAKDVLGSINGVYFCTSDKTALDTAPISWTATPDSCINRC